MILITIINDRTLWFITFITLIKLYNHLEANRIEVNVVDHFLTPPRPLFWVIDRSDPPHDYFFVKKRQKTTPPKKVNFEHFLKNAFFGKSIFA